MPDAPNENPEPPAETTEQPDVDGLKSALDKEREARKAAEKEAKRAKELETELQQFRDRDKTEQEKVAERLAAAEKAATDAETKYLRAKVALDKGLPAALAARLQGATEDEMSADADELLSTLGDRKQPPPSFDGGPRTPPPNGEGDMNTAIRRALGRS